MPRSPKAHGRGRGCGRGRRTLVGAALGALALSGSALPAHADPFGTGQGNPSWMADDLAEDYCFSGPQWSSNAGVAEMVNAAMGNLDSQTGMSRQQQSQCTTSTDIVWIINTTMIHRGTATCARRGAAFMCNQYIAEINPDVIRGQVPPGAPSLSYEVNLFKTTCHLVGISVGLQYGTTKDDCMILGDVSLKPASTQWFTYNAHHVAHINSHTLSTS
jgi:hypothetical protein